MSIIEKNLRELNKLQDLQQRSHWMNDLHPMGKLLINVLYIFTIASINKYDLTTLILMAIYLVFTFVVGELSVKEGLYRMRLILPLLIFAGIFNPFFDKRIITYIGTVAISGGVISMISLIIKGVFTVLAVYALIATTSIEDICYALRCIHVPKVLVVVIMLIYRYFEVMAKEADRIMTAYSLRAPSQKGIHYKAWGTLVGQWLLRSMDKAEMVYESMLLRGFNGDFKMQKKKVKTADIVYPIVWTVIFIAIRYFVHI